MDAEELPEFTSNKPEVATVAEDGTVTAVAPGQATITVEYDGAKATIPGAGVALPVLAGHAVDAGLENGLDGDETWCC